MLEGVKLGLDELLTGPVLIKLAVDELRGRLEAMITDEGEDDGEVRVELDLEAEGACRVRIAVVVPDVIVA